jgi:hypothetical protein
MKYAYCKLCDKYEDGHNGPCEMVNEIEQYGKKIKDGGNTLTMEYCAELDKYGYTYYNGALEQVTFTHFPTLTRAEMLDKVAHCIKSFNKVLEAIS